MMRGFGATCRAAAARLGKAGVAVAFAAAAGAAAPSLVFAQTPAAPPQAAPAATPEADVFTAEELDKLLAPVALFPDALLAQMLPAAAYPIDIVKAHRWIGKNKAAVEQKNFEDADRQDWDVSVKSMVRFPDLIKKMQDDLDWTTDLGEAFVEQPKDVADSIQRLRRKAMEAGALKSTPEQKVAVNDGSVVVQPANPEVVYVPQYDPEKAYKPSPAGAALLGFGIGVLVGTALDDDDYWDWRGGYVYPPVWARPPGYYPPGYRPGYNPPGYNPPGYNPPGYRPGYNPPGYNPPGYNPPGAGAAWRPDPYRYRPTTRPAPAAPAAAPVQRPTQPAAAPVARPPQAAAPPTVLRPPQAPQRDAFQNAGNTRRTEAQSQRGASSRAAAAGGARNAPAPGGGPRGGGRR